MAIAILFLVFTTLYYRRRALVTEDLKKDLDHFVQVTGWNRNKSIGRELISSRRYVEALEARNKRLGEALKNLSEAAA